MWDARREEAALFIQRLFRGWLARKRVNNLRKKREEQNLNKIRKEEEFRK
jgi:hypothetical protein